MVSIWWLYMNPFCFVKFRVFVNFLETALRAIHNRQATHTFWLNSGFLKRNHLAVSSRPLSDAWLIHPVPGFLFELPDGDEYPLGNVSHVGSIFVFSGFWENSDWWKRVFNHRVMERRELITKLKCVRGDLSDIGYIWIIGLADLGFWWMK